MALEFDLDMRIKAEDELELELNALALPVVQAAQSARDAATMAKNAASNAADAAESATTSAGEANKAAQNATNAAGQLNEALEKVEPAAQVAEAAAQKASESAEEAESAAADASAATQAALDAAARAESAAVAGVTFIPKVSSDGVISWTNDGGLANPEPVNITGPQGEKGDTPVKGEDYYTKTDKIEMVGMVKDEINKKYELIETITIEDSETLDLDRTGLSLRRLCIKAYSPAGTESLNKNFHAYTSDGKQAYVYCSPFTYTANQRVRLTYDLADDDMRSIFFERGDYNATRFEAAQTLRMAHEVADNDGVYINRFRLYSSSAPFISGTTLEVWGVRYDA